MIYRSKGTDFPTTHFSIFLDLFWVGEMRNPHSNGNVPKLEEADDATEENGYGDGVILGLDGGATSTVCVCVPFFPYGDRFPEPIPILGRAVAGCTNRNSVGGSLFSPSNFEGPSWLLILWNRDL